MKCPKCQLENPADANFCKKCGHRVISPPEETFSKPIPDAKHKGVTALFSELSGYTAMSEKRGLGDVSQITGRIFDGVKEILRKYEGAIENFPGDGVLALFGFPRAHEP